MFLLFPFLPLIPLILLNPIRNLDSGARAPARRRPLLDLEGFDDDHEEADEEGDEEEDEAEGGEAEVVGPVFCECHCGWRVFGGWVIGGLRGDVVICWLVTGGCGVGNRGMRMNCWACG